MSDYFFYDLNKKMADLANKQQLAETAQATPAKTAPNRLMEAAADYSAKKAAAGKDIGKPGKNFSKIAADAGKRYGSAEAGKRVAGAVLNKLRHPKEGMGFLGEKEVDEAYNPNSVDAENRRDLNASHAANLKKKAAAGDAKAQAELQRLKDKKERQSNDFKARMERESVGMDESALQAAFGMKKYTKTGMEKLQQLGREGASEKTKAAARKKFDQYDAKKDKVDESYANSADDTFEADIDFMTKVISGGLNKQKSTGQTTIPVIAGQGMRTGIDGKKDIKESMLNESVNDWKKLAGIIVK